VLRRAARHRAGGGHARAARERGGRRTLMPGQAPGLACAPALAAGMPLELAQHAAIDAALARCVPERDEHCLSDAAFSNLYLFRQPHAYRFHDGAYPHVSGRTYDGTTHALPLFSPAAAPAAALEALLRAHGCLYPLSGGQLARLDPARFAWQAARDDADYLYPADNFRHYRGTLLGKKRNLMRQFLAAHAVTARPYTPALAAEALAVQAQWLRDKDKREGEADDAACAEALHLSAALGLQGFLYEVGGQPAGFVLAQRIRPGVYVMRFAKGLDRFKGIYQYMFHHFCAAGVPDAAWLNFEQDMGLENFRRTKLSYQPAALLPKYRVRLR